MKGTIIVLTVVVVILLSFTAYRVVNPDAHALQGQPNISVQWLPGTDMNRLVDNDLGKVCYYNEKYIVCLPK